MKYSKEQALEILERTPAILKTILSGLSDEWTMQNEGPDTFSPYDVVGHLIHGEKTDWRDRTMIILEHGIHRSFTPYDRFAQNNESRGKSLSQLLDEFETLRAGNIEWFRSLEITESDLSREGMHPVLGKVSLRNLLSTWVIHDLTHVAQVTRVMAKQYKNEMGPWLEFFRIMNF